MKEEKHDDKEMDLNASEEEIVNWKECSEGKQHFADGKMELIETKQHDVEEMGLSSVESVGNCSLDWKKSSEGKQYFVDGKVELIERKQHEVQEMGLSPVE